MEESADEVNKREELLKMYHSTKEALKIISKSNVIDERSLNIIDKCSLNIPLKQPLKSSVSQILLKNVRYTQKISVSQHSAKKKFQNFL